MFNQKKNHSKVKKTLKAKTGVADTLISQQTIITGDIHFSGVLYIDGHVKGNILSVETEDTLLTIGINGIVEGDIQAPYITILGRIIGNVNALERIELMKKAHVNGNVNYQLMEMAIGAEINGKMLRSVEEPKRIAHKKKSSYKQDTEATLT
jgi:cytoskeletal protein CcmA (bactofilin family)